MIHLNVNFFTNSDELEQKLTAAIQKNKARLFPKTEERPIEAA